MLHSPVGHLASPLHHLYNHSSTTQEGNGTFINWRIEKWGKVKESNFLINVILYMKTDQSLIEHKQKFS